MSDATQADIDALTAELNTVAGDLGTVSSNLATSTAKLQEEIDSLATAHPGLDVTALKAAADALDPDVQTLNGSVQALGNLAPTPPSP